MPSPLGPIIGIITGPYANSNYTRYGQWTPTAVAAIVAWYDPSDLPTLWQDSARTTPVTTYGQPTGSMDDKTGNGYHVLQATAPARPTYVGSIFADTGADLVSNGGFATDTVWAKGAGWTISGGVANAAASSASLTEAISLTVPRLYRVTFTATVSAGTVTPQFTGGTTTAGAAISASGTYTIYIRTETGNTTLGFLGAGFTGTIDNVSVTEQAFSGYPCLYFDGADDKLIQSGSITLTLPSYLAIAAIKDSETNSVGFFGAVANSTNHHLIINVSSANRARTILRSTARGVVQPISGSEQFVVGVAAVVDAYAVAGTNGVQVNSNAEATLANTWIGGDTVATAKIGFQTTTATAATPHKCFGAVVGNAAAISTVERDTIKRFLVSKYKGFIG